MGKHGLILCLTVIVLGCGQSTKAPPLPASVDKGPRVSLVVHLSGEQADEDAVKTVKHKLTEQVKECGLSRIAPDLEKAAQWSIRIGTRRANDQDIKIGVSKIGGAPDLPEGTKWPRWKGTPLAFIAQLKMDDVAKHDLSGSLPQSGLLSFFYDARQETWGFDPNDRGSWQVLFFEGGQTVLRRTGAKCYRVEHSTPGVW